MCTEHVSIENVNSVGSALASGVLREERVVKWLCYKVTREQGCGAEARLCGRIRQVL